MFWTDDASSTPISVRVNPNVDAHTHAKITTGTYENKFGIAFEKIEAMELGRPAWTHCFASAEEKLLTVKWNDDREYRSTAPGADFVPLPDAPTVPAINESTQGSRGGRRTESVGGSHPAASIGIPRMLLIFSVTFVMIGASICCLPLR